MDCNIIKDLIPLYIDDCCSKESAALVRAHIEDCKRCRELYETLQTHYDSIPVISTPKHFRKINEWKALLLQSALLFISFAIITIGVALEAATPAGLNNGHWALSLIIPATGFMLSLTNWFFVRLYQTRKCFSNYSAFATLVIILCGYVWAIFHYELHIAELLYSIVSFYGIGAMLSATFVVFSKLLSNKYASLLGKE